MRNLVASRRKCRKTWAWLLAGIAVASDFSPAFSEERQYKIEAAYLYSFFNYITWPGYSSPQEMKAPVICVYGNDPILPYLYYVRNKTSQERDLTVQAISDAKSPENCNLIFMRHRLLQLAVPDNVLTVFKPDDPLDRGGMIELSEDGERIVIKINQAQLDKNGFTISSRLLDLTQKMR